MPAEYTHIHSLSHTLIHSPSSPSLPSYEEKGRTRERKERRRRKGKRRRKIKRRSRKVDQPLSLPSIKSISSSSIHPHLHPW